MKRTRTRTLTLIPVAAVLAAVAAGCGSSSAAPGVQTAPSAGATVNTTAVASAPTSPTPTSPTATSSVPLPAALKARPKVPIPAGAAPKKLVVKDLIKGTGPAATATSTVTVQYVGELYKNGSVFDASWDHPGAQPATFPLTGVIQGWQQGIPGMRVGGRRELIIPPGLAYMNHAQAKIPANSTLVFVIDLHNVS